jgi:hypothetical protein
VAGRRGPSPRSEGSPDRAATPSWVPATSGDGDDTRDKPPAV